MPFLGTTPTQGFVGANPKQSFTANGSTTVFTLTNPVATANDLEVFVGNVRQEPTAAYSAAGTTLTMSEAPATGLNFYVINKSQAQVTTTPPVNSISTDKIVNSAVTDAKIGGLAATKLTGTVAGARLPAGTVLQTVFGVNSTNQQLANDTTTFATTTTASITPSSTSSKIFIIAHGSADIAFGNYRAIYFRILRSVGGTDQVVRASQYLMYGDNLQTHNIATQPIQALDAPGTTSAITYSIQGRHQSGSTPNTAYNGYLSRYSQSTLTLMEIAQ